MARAPQKIRSLLVFDFETGGLDKKDRRHSSQYPVTEFGAMGLDGVELREIGGLKYDNFVKPYDPKLIYSEEASKITGITRELCEKDGIPLRQLVDDIVTFINETNLHNSRTARPVLVGHNVQFDIDFFTDIFRRAEVDLSKLLDGEFDCHGNFYPHFVDTNQLAQQCWAEVTDTDTNFKLGTCCQRAGVDYIDGHRAMNDVYATADLLRYFTARLRSGEAVKISGGQATVHRQKFEW